MNTMELKGNFISLLAEVDDPDLLKLMLEKCLHALRKEERLDVISVETLAVLKAAVAVKINENELIPNDDANKEGRNNGKRSKEELFDSLRKSLHEVELHRQGKIKLPTIEEVLNEL